MIVIAHHCCLINVKIDLWIFVYSFMKRWSRLPTRKGVYFGKLGGRRHGELSTDDDDDHHHHHECDHHNGDYDQAHVENHNWSGREITIYCKKARFRIKIILIHNCHDHHQFGAWWEFDWNHCILKHLKIIRMMHNNMMFVFNNLIIVMIIRLELGKESKCQVISSNCWVTAEQFIITMKMKMIMIQDSFINFIYFSS